MAFSVNKLIHVACQMRSWFVLYAPGEIQGVLGVNNYAQTSHANDFVNAKSHTGEKPLLAGYLRHYPKS